MTTPPLTAETADIDRAFQCPKCRCCDMEWQECESCDDGFSGHDCGEDTCCCLYPEENMPCDICGGEGGWWICGGRCDEHGKHKEGHP